MGLINIGRIQQRISTGLEERRKQKEEERRLQKEIEAADKKALHEARLRASGDIAAAKVAHEVELTKKGIGVRKKGAFEQLTGQPFFTSRTNQPQKKKTKSINEEINDIMGW